MYYVFRMESYVMGPSSETLRERRTFLNPSEIAVLNVLLARRDEQRHVCLTIKQIAKAAEFSLTQVKRDWKAFRKRGWIERKTLGGKRQWYVNPPVSVQSIIASYSAIDGTKTHDPASLPSTVPYDYADIPSERVSSTAPEESRAAQSAIHVEIEKVPSTVPDDAHTGPLKVARQLLVNVLDHYLRKNLRRYGVELTKSEHTHIGGIATVVHDKTEVSPKDAQESKGQQSEESARLLGVHLAKKLGRDHQDSFRYMRAIDALKRMLAACESFDAVRDILDEAMLPENRKELSEYGDIDPSMISSWACRTNRIPRNNKSRKLYASWSIRW
jgi:DNA-binding MarR family transcriptional regulator